MTYERINFVDQSVERPRTYEMTHNADGSVTLVDSFGLVDELGTPINADTMNHIEDGIVNNDNRITYLEDRQIVDYKIQNMLTTGSISTDEQGYNQLENMYHSTFDLSKFTVVGSPTITDDGVASGFSRDQNYITIPFAYNNFTIKMPILWNGISPVSSDYYYQIENLTKTEQIILYQASDGKLEVMTKVDGTTHYEFGRMVISPNIPVFVIMTKDDTKINIKVEQENTITFDKTVTTNIPTFDNNSVCNIGKIWNTINYCSIDLTQFSITVDGVPVFNGNKTGLDVIKQDNYTVVGSPTISEDGVLTNNYSNNTNYVSIPFGKTGNWQVDFQWKSPNTLVGSYILTSWASSFTRITVNNTYAQLSCILNMSDGTTLNLGNISNVIQKANTIYNIYIEHNGTTYSFGIKELGSIEYKTLSVTSELEVNNNPFIIFANSDETDKGSIDLNAFKIYVDGNLVYQACLKVPYTESKTGSKIVDAIYRDRVEDAYNQFGTEYLYYTINEENKNFTLPMGEIYGMIENAKTNRTIGEIIQVNASSAYVPEGCLPCDGAEYTKAQFEQFFTNYLMSGKLNTCTYSEYQSDITTYGQCDKFALDTTNNKFKVPTIADEQISDIADTVPVKGNGITMGLTNGTTEYGLMSVAGSGAPVLEPYKNASGISVGSAPTFSADNISQTLGLSADETKSGVITNTANSKKYLALRYFVVVANGSVNQSMMDWSQWASSLQGKANTDLENATPNQTFIDKTLSWIVPDFENAITVTSLPYIIPSYGWWCHYGINANGNLYINGVQLDIYSYAGNNWAGHQSAQILLSAGDEITVVGEKPANMKFIPCKGV